jgi:hypothetical protein
MNFRDNLSQLNPMLGSIYVLEVPHWAQPSHAPFKYPQYAEDYGIEQDFLSFLSKHSELCTNNYDSAQYFYLPIFWTRLHLLGGYGQTGVDRLRELVEPLEAISQKMFTVCQYDDGPLVDLGQAKIFLGSRKNLFGFDAPLLCTDLPKPRPWAPNRKRRYLASFSGRLSTHPFREAMANAIDGIQSVKLEKELLSSRKYADLLRSSKIALAPRGYGGSSFRFYEALQLGTVPWLIGDIDTRPFKNQISWNDISYYSASPEQFLEDFTSLNLNDLEQKLNDVSNYENLGMGLGQWPTFLLNELQNSYSQGSF